MDKAEEKNVLKKEFKCKYKNQTFFGDYIYV